MAPSPGGTGALGTGSIAIFWEGERRGGRGWGGEYGMGLVTRGWCQKVDWKNGSQVCGGTGEVQRVDLRVGVPGKDSEERVNRGS